MQECRISAAEGWKSAPLPPPGNSGLWNLEGLQWPETRRSSISTSCLPFARS